jgi:hypothetical protein
MYSWRNRADPEDASSFLKSRVTGKVPASTCLLTAFGQADSRVDVGQCSQGGLRLRVLRLFRCFQLGFYSLSIILALFLVVAERACHGRIIAGCGPRDHAGQHLITFLTINRTRSR